MKNLYLNKMAVLQYMCDNEMSIGELAELCSISKRTLERYLERNTSICLTSLFKLANGMNVSIEEIAFIKN